MKTSVHENLITFKELEQGTFEKYCAAARLEMKQNLEGYDDYLFKERDKSKYRDKGRRKTTIKTVFGEVTYWRRLYCTKNDEGHNIYIYLLDKALKIDKIGCFSVNLVEKIISNVTKTSFRATAEMISETTGQSISHGGAWNVSQRIGERIVKEEEVSVEKLKADELQGERNVDVLFEEIDGVGLSLQDKKHKKLPSREMKVAVHYEGLEKDKTRSSLREKTVIAGMETSAEFHEKREALIRKKYNADDIKYRVLNGDGASWIRDTYDPDTIFQLDRFHIHQAIKRNIGHDKGQVKIIERLFADEKIDEMLEHILRYSESVKSDDPSGRRSKNAMELYGYLHSNKDGLLSYKNRGIKYPVPPDGVRYGNLGVQENQNCTVIALRMKGKRRRWSPEGANNMAKLLYRKENKELVDTVNRYCEELVFSPKTTETITNMSAGAIPKKIGKGSPYVDIYNMHVPLRDVAQTPSSKAFIAACL